MRTASYTELRENLASLLDSVTEDHTPVLVTRDRGKPSAVLMSLEDFTSYEETRYLLASPRNAERLLEAVSDLMGGGGSEQTLPNLPPTDRVKLIFHAKAWEDYLHWQATDIRLLDRLNGLIKECTRTPFEGIGKPEPLRGQLSGWWSRRITREHRLVYRPTEDGLLIAQCRHHY